MNLQQKFPHQTFTVICSRIFQDDTMEILEKILLGCTSVSFTSSWNWQDLYCHHYILLPSVGPHRRASDQYQAASRGLQVICGYTNHLPK